MTAPLHRAPDGTWIDLGEVVSLQPHSSSSSDWPGRVRVWMHRHVVDLWFTSYDNAERYADELAALVNAERTKP